jgi:translation elongation factor EF-Ts
MHYKIQSAGGNDKTGLVDAHDPDGSRKRLVQNAGRQNMIEVMNTWQKIAQDPKNANKPAMVQEKMSIGKLNKRYKEVCLLDQPFVKDDKMSVKDYVAKTAKELGGDIKVVKFLRYEKGEGLEKRNEDFAAEVAAQINK